MVEVCVVDSDGAFLYTADLETYVLQDGESFVHAYPPALRMYAGFPGFVKPTWNGSKWVEGADFLGIIEWEMTHIKSAGESTATIWNEMEQSYQQGVNTAYDQ